MWSPPSKHPSPDRNGKRAAPQLFRSFWMAGFESACHVNAAGRRLDMIAATQHDRFVREDYGALREVGIATAREALRWHVIERSRGHYDFESVRPFVDAAASRGIQVVWSLFHYGWPDDIDIFAAAFVDRFARFARAAARFLRDGGDETLWFTPINEISFMAWAGGERGLFNPFTRGRGAELKRQLVRAEIAAIEAIRDVDRGARFMHTDPLIRVVPPAGRPDLAAVAQRDTEAQHEARDALIGRYHRELGGRPEHLDVIGLNFYPPNQWEYPSRPLRRPDGALDPRWRPLHQLLAEVYARYRRPLVIAETSALGPDRTRWLLEMADEVRRAADAGVPVEGICLYPALSRPDWDDPNHWHDSGLWDLQADEGGKLVRIRSDDYAAALEAARGALGGTVSGLPGGQIRER